MKPGHNRDELCYPFIYETASLCDYEVITDELCAHIGAALSHTPVDMPGIAADLDRLQPLAFHLNGSIRGRLAVEESDLAWLQERLDHFREEVRLQAGPVRKTISPRGIDWILPPCSPRLRRIRGAWCA